MTPTSAGFFHVDLLTLCVTCFQLEGLPLAFLVRQQILSNLFIWFISSFFLKDSFVGYRILLDRFFFLLSYLTVLSHHLLASIVFSESSPY